MQIKINGQTISLAAPEPFLSILRRENIYFPLYCGGRGTCGKCRIRITEGSLPITTEDRQFFSEDGDKNQIINPEHQLDDNQRNQPGPD